MDIESVLTEYGALLSRVANSYEANAALQAELFQEICVAVWQGLDRFKGESNIKTYILRIAHNRAVSHVAKEINTPKSQTDDTQLLEQIESFNSPEKNLVNERNLDALLSAVRNLKLPARQIFTLSLEGLSYKEIAEISGESSTNVGAIISRTRASILREIQHVE